MFHGFQFQSSEDEREVMNGKLPIQELATFFSDLPFTLEGDQNVAAFCVKAPRRSQSRLERVAWPQFVYRLVARDSHFLAAIRFEHLYVG